MTKKYDSKSSLKEKLRSGVDILANNVSSTLGPKGRNVIIHKKGERPFITKDGVTVAKFIDLDDEFENVGAQIVKQASAKTNIDAGDGTTTSTVLAREIFSQALDLDEQIDSVVEVKRGIDKAVSDIEASLLELARPIKSKEDVAHIATISANGDVDIGNLIALAVDKVGKDGSITIEEARSVDTTLDLEEGFKFDSGYAASAFVTDDRRGVARYEDPLFLLTDQKLESVDQILPALEIAARESRPFVIISDEIEGQALAALIMNSIRGTMKVAAIKSPRYGEERRNIMSDLALSVGAKYFRRSSGDNLKDVKLNDFGSAKTIEIGKASTIIVGGSGEYSEIDDRIEMLKEEVQAKESLADAERVQERITRLASGIAVIRVGSATEIEMIEKKHRIEDALEAVRSAQLEGVVPGGGTALLKASELVNTKPENPSQQIGIDIVIRAIEAPLRQMSLNSGLDPDTSVEKVKSLPDEQGINFATGDTCNLYDVGIIDPVKVTRCALRNAASVAGTLLTTNYAIVEGVD